MQALTTEFLEEIRRLKEMSVAVGNTRETFLEFIEKHAKEVRDLLEKEDPHFAVEAADLIILCAELLELEGKEINSAIETALPRFHKKLAEKEKE